MRNKRYGVDHKENHLTVILSVRGTGEEEKREQIKKEVITALDKIYRKYHNDLSGDFIDLGFRR